ncbi:MAG: oligosaccharide flippase family protein [bacterium]
MIENLKKLFRHSFVYSISSIAAKAIGVILLPLYTKYIPLGDYGDLAVVDITIMILVELLILGQGQSLAYIANSEEYKDKIKPAFFSIFASVMIINLFFVFLCRGFVVPQLAAITGNISIQTYSEIAVWIILLRVINTLFVNKLRADEKSIAYTIANLARLLISLGLAIYFIAVKGMGVSGLFTAYLIGEGLVFIIMLPLMLRQMEFRFEKPVIIHSMKFGYPLIFNSIPFMLLNLSDRYILAAFRGQEVVGLYDLGYRIAGIMNMLFIIPFNLAMMPIVYKIYNTKGDKLFYSKLLTYSTFVFVWTGLALSLFAKEILSVFSFNDAYNEAYIVVPVITLSYVFSGMRLVAVIGTFVKQQTKYIALSTLIAALLNIALNFITVPKYGMMSAAYNTLICFVLLHYTSIYFSNKFYPVDYKNFGTLFMILLGTGFYIIIFEIEKYSYGLGLTLKIGVTILFPVLMITLRYFNKSEVKYFIKVMESLKNPANIKNIFSAEINN